MYRTIKLKALELCPVDVTVDAHPDLTDALRHLPPTSSSSRRPAQQRRTKRHARTAYIQPSLTQFFSQNAGSRDTMAGNQEMQQDTMLDAIQQGSPSHSHKHPLQLRGSSTNEIIADFLEQLSRDPSLSSADSLYHLARTLAENGSNDTQMDRTNALPPLSHSESSVMLKLTQALVAYVTSRSIDSGLPSPELSAVSSASSLSPPTHLRSSQETLSQKKQHVPHHRKRFPIPLVVPATSPRREPAHEKPSSRRSASPSRLYDHELAVGGRLRSKRSLPDRAEGTSSSRRKTAR